MTSEAKAYPTKRVFDLLILLAVSIPALVLGVLSAFAIALTSRGPVLFRQVRVGANGKPFEILKFRTMTHGKNPMIPDPSRITGVGRILRRLSLDELPQLINVLRGEMSIVGPRPTLEYQVQRYSEEQRHRLDVRPGLTGLAQVSGRNSLNWDDRITLDVEYVRTQSIRTDLAILSRTLQVVVGGIGVDGHAEDDDLSVEEQL